MSELKPSINEIVEGMIDVVSRKYSYLAIKLPEFEQVKNILKTNVDDVKDYAGLMNLAQEALSTLKDGHVRVIDGQGHSYHSHSTYPDRGPKNYNLAVIDHYLSNVEQSGPITMGKIGDILYLGLDSFHSRNKKHYDWLYNREFPHENKFIIDLRANGGGNDGLGKTLASFILGSDGPIVSSYIRKRIDEDDPTKLTDFMKRYVMPEQGDPRRKAVVLIGAGTYSSAELITMDLAAIPGTLLIGDVTGGGSGCPQRYLVDGPYKGKKIDYDKKPNDFEAKFALDVPSWLSYRLDQVLLEGNGILPHIRIAPDKSIDGMTDHVLEKAIDVHRNGYIAK